VGLMIVAPILIITIIYYMLASGVSTINLDIVEGCGAGRSRRGGGRSTIGSRSERRVYL
jgi:hypothetical protein